ncbi:MAG TPA: SDR family oxidoreductase, partial [Solirubrobacteraceae bacterium]|nr:SDR family oxidoreductase [Solirubrobacteraceae bacterium]
MCRATPCRGPRRGASRRALRDRRGVIQQRASAGQPARHYAAAKAALTNYSKSLSLQVAGDGVRVNTVSPGLTLTPAIKRLLTSLAEAGGTDVDTARENLTAEIGGIPLGAPGEP